MWRCTQHTRQALNITPLGMLGGFENLFDCSRDKYSGTLVYEYNLFAEACL